MMDDQLTVQGASFTAINPKPTYFQLVGNDGRTLLKIDLRDGSVTGEVEDAGEAAAVFVAEVRRMMGDNSTVSDAS